MAPFILLVLLSSLVGVSPKHVKHQTEKKHSDSVGQTDMKDHHGLLKYKKQKPTLFFDGAENSISGDLDDFFKSYKTYTSQPACTTSPTCPRGHTCSEHCYGPTGNVLFAVCYDQDRKIPIYSAEYFDGATIGTGGRANNFKQDSGPYGPKSQASDADYSQTVQLKNHGQWTKGRFYLARGHLAASADFGANQRFTFILTNVAPQWQAFNNGNWKVLETALRILKSKLLVVTGTAEPLTNIMLENGVKVPEFFWKAVCDTTRKESMFFYSVNPVDDKSTTKQTECGAQQTENRGVVKCDSINNAIKKFPNWGIPDLKGCSPTVQGMAGLTTELKKKLK